MRAEEFGEKASTVRRLLPKSYSCPALQSLRRPSPAGDSRVRTAGPVSVSVSVSIPYNRAAMHSVSPQRPVQITEGKTPQDETRRPKPAMVDMPPEVHHLIMDFLNIVDGTCLGLASRYFYQLHRRRHGLLPLSTTPNDPNTEAAAAAAATARVRASSHVTLVPFRASRCRICGFALCELRKHLRDWMPPGLEYCPVLGRYAPAQVPDADADADAYCYRRNPKNARVCGRHHWKERESGRRAMVG
ncbi:hypothetical protein CTA2_9958 [Colletotrichum tanaceti]|nr:hypothetical protein CTA2_9958 [Colletotrichum tanaceti]